MNKIKELLGKIKEYIKQKIIDSKNIIQDRIIELLGKLFRTARKFAPLALGVLAVYAYMTKDDVPVRYRYHREGIPSISLATDYTDNSKLSPLVHLAAEEDGKKSKFFCSGTVIDDHYILTAAHCVEDKIDAKIEIRDNHNKATGISCEVGAYNSNSDIAVLHCENLTMFSKQPYDAYSAAAAYSKTMISCGFPWGSSRALCVPFRTVGIRTFKVAGVGAAVYTGMSGGPVIDASSGVIVAVIHAVANNVEYPSVSQDTPTLVAPTIGFLDDLDLQPKTP